MCTLLYKKKREKNLFNVKYFFFYFIENNLTYSNANSQIQVILKERCDGNRNILHACVNMCSPTSNKETEQGNICLTHNFNTTRVYNKNYNFFLLSILCRIFHLTFYFIEVIERELVSNTVDNTSAPIEEPIPTLSWPPEAFDNTSGEEDSLLSIGAASISMMNKSSE